MENLAQEYLLIDPSGVDDWMEITDANHNEKEQGHLKMVSIWNYRL